MADPVLTHPFFRALSLPSVCVVNKPIFKKMFRENSVLDAADKKARSGKLESFKNNPQQFLKEALIMLRVAMQKCLVDGIKYHKIGDHMVYTQELFENEELIGYLDKNMQEAKKSVYDHVVYDSESVEAQIASDFEKDERIKVYAKLPSWFKIDTPLGSYNPDWAVLFEEDGQERLYLVVETKETPHEDLLRPEAKYKISCGKEHFKALKTGIQYHVTNSLDHLIAQCESNTEGQQSTNKL